MCGRKSVNRVGFIDILTCHRWREEKENELKRRGTNTVTNGNSDVKLNHKS